MFTIIGAENQASKVPPVNPPESRYPPAPVTSLGPRYKYEGGADPQQLRAPLTLGRNTSTKVQYSTVQYFSLGPCKSEIANSKPRDFCV